MKPTIKIETLDAVLEMDDVFQRAKVAAELEVLSASHAGAVERIHIKASAIRDVVSAAIPVTKTASAIVKYHQMISMSDSDIVDEVNRIVAYVKDLNKNDLLQSVKRPTVSLKKLFTPAMSATSTSIQVRC